MSLSKQLLILLTLLFFIIFSVSFVLSVGNIKNYLEVESKSHVQDTATSLGLSLSPHMVDEHDPIIRTMMNAIFDRGYYKEMRLVNVDGEDLVVLTNTDQMEGVPSWLIGLVSMQTATAVSEISSGWNISATLYVTANPSYGYLKLFHQGKETLTISVFIFIAAVVLLIALLRLTLRPLKAIEKQANAISSGNFITLTPLPWTLEVKNVAISMNSMSSKIGNMIEKVNGELETLSDRLKRDSLTQLFNSATFETDIRLALTDASSGYSAVIKFDNLNQITKTKGNEVVDKLLIDFATLLNRQKGNHTSYRLSGSEFALLMPSVGEGSVISNITQLKSDIEHLADNYQLDDIVHIGIVHFQRTSSYKKLYPAMIEAYEQAKNIGSKAYYIKDDFENSMSDIAWKELITSTIENNTPEITFTAEAYDYQKEPAQKVMKEAFTVIKDNEGNDISIGTFFSMAQEFNLAEALDKCIINKVIQLIEKSDKTTPVTINLSMTSVKSHSFNSWLATRIAIAAVKPELLVFGLTTYSVKKDINSFANFCIFMNSIGAKTLLKRYSSDIVDVDLLKGLHINYLRLSRELTSHIADNVDKAKFLELIHDVSALLEIKVLAEGVKDDDDFTLVKATKLDGISR